MHTLDNFYKSKEWTKLLELLWMERVEADGFVYCEECNRRIFKKRDGIGHHEIELTDTNVNDYSVSLNQENIKLIHHRCHNKRHKRFGFEVTKKVFLVYGSPCSGKVEWIKDNAGVNDVIVDMDRIHRMISINPIYVKSKVLDRNAFMVRDCIMDMIRTRYGKWENAFIVGGYPLSSERERIVNAYNATPIYIEADKGDCIERAADRPKEWQAYIEQWWERFTPDC